MMSLDQEDLFHVARATDRPTSHRQVEYLSKDITLKNYISQKFQDAGTRGLTGKEFGLNFMPPERQQSHNTVITRLRVEHNVLRMIPVERDIGDVLIHIIHLDQWIRENPSAVQAYALIDQTATQRSKVKCCPHCGESLSTK